MARFDNAVALAKRLIAKNGQDATLRSFTVGAPPDASKPWKPGTNVPVEVTVKAVFLEYEEKYVDGTVIRTGDQKVYIPAYDTSGNAVSPAQDSQLLRGAEVWKIVKPKPLNPNGQAIMFELQVRQ